MTNPTAALSLALSFGLAAGLIAASTAGAQDSWPSSKAGEPTPKVPGLPAELATNPTCCAPRADKSPRREIHRPG